MSNYSLQSHTYRKGITQKTIDNFVEIATETCPDLIGLEVEGHTLVGKYNRGKRLYLFIKEVDGEEQYWSANLYDANEAKKPKGPRASAPGAIGATASAPEEMNLEIIKLGDIKYNPDLFIPIKSGTPLDYVFSKKGGTMPATNYILIGDPGIGKSTLSIEYAAQLQANNTDKKILFISGEMTRIDMAEYLERFPAWKALQTVFVSEFTEGRYKDTIEHWFNQGWDFIVGDSFAEIVDAVKEDYNMFYGKMSSTGAEKWLIDLMVANNLGNNEAKLHTAHLLIQQVTKGGKFVGSNKLKHNTTGMIELRYTKTSERTIIIDKNRRGWKYQNLHFEFNEDLNKEPIVYDVERVHREIEQHKKINSERDQLRVEEKLLDEMWKNNKETDVRDDIDYANEQDDSHLENSGIDIASDVEEIPDSEIEQF